MWTQIRVSSGSSDSRSVYQGPLGPHDPKLGSKTGFIEGLILNRDPKKNLFRASAWPAKEFTEGPGSPRRGSPYFGSLKGFQSQFR